jgi:hypothetical protein
VTKRHFNFPKRDSRHIFEEVKLLGNLQNELVRKGQTFLCLVKRQKILDAKGEDKVILYLTKHDAMKTYPVLS